MIFNHIFSRADEEIVQKILGRDSLRLINLIFSRVSLAQLRQFIILLHSEEGILLSKEFRPFIFDLLKPEEAKNLAILFNKSTSGDLYKNIKAISFNKNSINEQKLLQFFGLEKLPEQIVEEHDSYTNICPNYSLFPYQRQAVSEILKKINTEQPRVILHMPTGSGKTRTAMHIICNHLNRTNKGLVIWLAYSEELCEQAATEFETAWKSLGNRNIDIYRFWKDYEIEPAKLTEGFLVAGFSKIFSRIRNSIEFIDILSRKATFVIIDEAHQAIADTYSLILESLTVQNPTKGLLGLTATPGRTYNDICLDEELAKFFYRQKVMLNIEGYTNPVDYLVDNEYLAKVEFKSLFYEKGFDITERDEKAINENLDVPEYLMKKLAEDDKRTLAIISALDKLIKEEKHTRIIVFTSTVEHSEILASILNLKEIRSYSITSKTNDYNRRRYIENYKSSMEEPIVLCNYGVLTTGFDAPKTSAAIVARPTKSLVLYSQMVGRAIRGKKAGGNSFAKILTVVDFELPGFKSVQQAFTNWEDVYN